MLPHSRTSMKKNLLLYIFLFFTLSAFCQQSDLAGQYLFNPYLLNPTFGNDLHGNNITLGIGLGEGPMKMAPKHASVQVIIRPTKYPVCFRGYYGGFKQSHYLFFLGGKFQQTSTEITRKEHYQASFGFDFIIDKKTLKYGSISELRLASSISMGLGKALLSITNANQLFPSGEIGLRLYKHRFITKWSIGLSANNLVFKNIQYSDIELETPNPFKPFYSVHGEYAFRLDYNWRLKPKAFFFLNNGQDIGMFALESIHDISDMLQTSLGSAYSTNDTWTFFGRMKFGVQKVAVFDLFYAYQTNTTFNTPHQIGIGLGQIAKSSQRTYY